MPDESYYLEKIKSLEAELHDREQDLTTYRSELAVANKRLETLISQLNQELKSAHAVQKSLVPTEYPNIKGVEFSSKFIPSMIAGGDYFDIFEHEDRFRYGVIVAGCSGYSMSALLLSVLLKLTGKMEARKGAEPHKVVASIADEIVPAISGEDSAEVFYAMIDRRSFDMHYCRVGDIIALHLDFSSNKIELLQKSSPALGRDFGEDLESFKLKLNPKDRIIVCSKGVIDCQNLDGESFGKDRLFQAILSAPRQGVHELRNEILFQVSQFSKGAEVKRDMTVLVQEVKEKLIKLA